MTKNKETDHGQPVGSSAGLYNVTANDAFTRVLCAVMGLHNNNGLHWGEDVLKNFPIVMDNVNAFMCRSGSLIPLLKVLVPVLRQSLSNMVEFPDHSKNGNKPEVPYRNKRADEIVAAFDALWSNRTTHVQQDILILSSPALCPLCGQGVHQANENMDIVSLYNDQAEPRANRHQQDGKDDRVGSGD